MKVSPCKCKTCQCEANLPYRPGTPLDAIVEDGFYRGFKPEQTIIEAHEMGYEIRIKDLEMWWGKLEREMIEYFESQAREADAASVGKLEFDIDIFKGDK